MEEELDEVARGERAWVPLLRAFYGAARATASTRSASELQAAATSRPRRPTRSAPRATRWSSASGATAGSWPARCIPEHKEIAAAARRGGRRPRPARARSARSAARGRSSASAAGSGRSSAARATRTATTSRRTARRRPTRCRSRSPARRTTTATSSPRRARRTGNVFWGCSNYPKCDFTTNFEPVGALHDADDGPVARKGEAGDLPAAAAPTIPLPEDAIVARRAARRAVRPNPEALAPAGARRRRRRRRRGDGAAPAGDARRPTGRARGPADASAAPGRDRRRARDRRRVSRRDRDRARPRAVPRGRSRRATRRRTRSRSYATAVGAYLDWLADARRRLADARRGRTCAPTSRALGDGPRADARSRSGWRRSARSIAAPPREGLAPGDPWGAIATPRLPRRLPRVLEVDAGRAAAGGRRRASSPRPTRPRRPDALATALALRDRALVETAYAAGLRISELAAADLGVARPAPRRDPGARQGPQGADRAARAAGARGARRRISRTAGPSCSLDARGRHGDAASRPRSS